ncbi:hypothetical protein BHM03_00008906 [Ensete ventricosum]|nr:hypothetical protein BHM03_00008906 [Ensete ventricosum]
MACDRCVHQARAGYFSFSAFSAEAMLLLQALLFTEVVLAVEHVSRIKEVFLFAVSRIPCEYNKNLSIRVEEKSQSPNYLAVKFLYQGGQTDIVAVDVAQLRMVVTGGYDGKWVWAQEEVLPVDWKTGSVYELGLQITDIAREGCFTCDTKDWK